MKTQNTTHPSGILILLLTLVCLCSYGQTTSYYSISGVVKDRRNNKKLEYATISVPGTAIGTVTNADGEFSIKINDSIKARSIEVRHLGYNNGLFPIKGYTESNIAIYLTSNAHQLKDVVVAPRDMTPGRLVRMAAAKVVDNFSSKDNMLTGFYRETVKKRRTYITISEAIVDVYKTPYRKGVLDDKVRIYKGRKLLSPSPKDTLAVKLLGGPTLAVYMDIAKDTDIFLDDDMLKLYKFDWEESVLINERPHYVVSFKPQYIALEPLNTGKLYIDQASLTFSRVEISVDMSDRNKVTRLILRKKPPKLRFKPEEVSFVINYKEQDGVSYLSYIGNEIRFKCDWSRRLFSTGYTVVSEMVITDRQVTDIEKISRKAAFSNDNSLSDKVSSFYDPGFWEDYNIIEPTESLENAVDKLRKKNEEN